MILNKKSPRTILMKEPRLIKSIEKKFSKIEEIVLKI
jgi:hypothetical protein